MAGGYAHRPEGVQAIVAEFRELKKLNDDVARRITALGLQIDPDGNLITDGNHRILSSNFDGDVDAGTAGTMGWGLGGPDGNAIFNNLILRGGIIGNDALANPVAPAGGIDSGSSYGVPKYLGLITDGGTTRASVTLTVPAGFTKAALFACSQDVAINSTGSTDAIYSWCGLSDGSHYVYGPGSAAAAGALAASTAILVYTLTGLTGGDSFTIQSRPFVAFTAWSTSATNSTTLGVNCQFFR